MRKLGLACLLASACAGTEAMDASVPDARLDAPVVIPDARFDVMIVDGRGLVIHGDATIVLRDAAPVPDASLIDAPPPIDARPVLDAPPGTPDAAPPCDIELLANAGFEDSTGTGQNKNIAPWVQSPGDIVVTAGELAANGQPAPQAGNFAAWLGGESARQDYIYQPVTVPAATTSLTLRGYLYIRTNEPVPNQHDQMQINVYNASQNLLETVAVYYDGDETTGWRSFTQTIAGNYAGKTILLAFESVNGFFYSTSFFVDALSLDARVCP
ncbi:MAG TPA: hypothetical protein VKE22_16145 [Haliangiales bacterium]|nr:hypothetical protein [Haliangiales bacterium]